MALAFAAVILIAVLAFFALQLANSQSDSRAEIERRFDERPQIAAALTESLFAATTASGADDLERQYGGATVTDAEMTEAAEEGNNVFSALYDDSGELIALSNGAPPAIREDYASGPPFVRQVLEGQPIALSNLLDLGPSAEAVTAFAQGVDTDFGKRVVVNGIPPGLLGTFLGQYLSQVPHTAGGQTYLLDSNARVVASSRTDIGPGDPVDAPDLVAALERSETGTFGDDMYFAASPIENSPWEVVSTASESELFGSVEGANKWIPWVIFTAFALAAIAALWLVQRVARSAAALSEAHDRLEATNRALERRAKELEQSNAELDQFASIASHDLQEPLRKVRMFSEKVADVEAENLSDQGRDYLRRSSEAAGRMQLLIQDLLEFSRVATRARPMVETDIGKLAHEVASDLEGTVAEAGGKVEIGELPTVAADPAQIRRLLQNLISNGLKFRREDVPPVVRIDGGRRGRFVEISVTDNGIGFDPKYASRIFRVFERLHGRGEYQGTGIGLALARKIAERHGGTVAAESTPGAGATFTVTLLAEADEVGAGAARPVGAGGRDDQR